MQQPGVIVPITTDSFAERSDRTAPVIRGPFDFPDDEGGNTRVEGPFMGGHDDSDTTDAYCHEMARTRMNGPFPLNMGTNISAFNFYGPANLRDIRAKLNNGASGYHVDTAAMLAIPQASHLTQNPIPYLKKKWEAEC
jgi:hypothetical protein